MVSAGRLYTRSPSGGSYAHGALILREARDLRGAVPAAGRFPNGDRAGVASFAVGASSGEQRKSSGLVVDGDDGERIRVLVVPER
jgi:hypothetical protein